MDFMVSNTKYKWYRYKLYLKVHFLSCLHVCYYQNVFFMIETEDCNLTLQTFFWKGGGVYWLVIESSAAVNLDNFID